MLAERIPTVLPPLGFDEALEVTRIYSVAGMLDGQGLVVRRPFRSPHHTISQIALIGGGSHPRPGEVSLAHRGVLFLDELPEYQKTALEVLRQPLEQGEVTVSRAARNVTFPADCMLVAAMNPCPCGFQTDPRHTCACSPQQIERYRAKLSGPLLDRIDLHVEVPAVPFDDLRARRPGSDSAAMRERIAMARAVQAERYAGTSCRTNADLSGSLLEEHCRPGPAEHDFLREAMHSLALSARAYTRILRISRTIADLEQSRDLRVAHLAEAINFRALDREHLL
jgi:magnesium chelatase family protein